MLRATSIVTALLWGSACHSAPSQAPLPRACTMMGCEDQASFAVRSPSAAWPPGAYVVALTVDGQAYSCPLQLPSDLPAQGVVASIACQGPGAVPPQLSLMQDSICTEQRTSEAISQSCLPVPDRYTIEGRVAGTPAALVVDIQRDGQAVLHRPLTLEYAETRPNGPGCDPLCKQSRTELDLP
jgi:hypothetical protein